MKKHITNFILMGFSIVLLLPGCARRKTIIKDAFLLNAPRSGAAAKTHSQAVLAVQPFSIAPAFAGKGLIYRTGDNQYESDFYNEYLASPQSMIADQTRNWLSESGRFGQVLSPVSSVSPGYVLEAHIRQMVADMRDDSDPRSVLEMTFFLVQQQKRERTILFSKTYRADVSLEEKTPAAYIDALNQCLSRVLGELESDLAANLKAP